MEKIIWKGGALTAPVPPVLVSCHGIGEDGKEHDNVITVAWTGIINTNPPKTYISVRPSRFSYRLIKSSGEFVINLSTVSLIRTVDKCGVYTGAKVDKFKTYGLTAQPAEVVKCPMIAESPLSLECKVFDIIPLGSHDMFLADIVSVSVASNLISADGKLHLEKAGLAAFAHGDYYALGKHIGYFGFSVKKKSGKGR